MKAKSIDFEKFAIVGKAAGFNVSKLASSLIDDFISFAARRIANEMKCVDCPVAEMCASMNDTPCADIIRKYITMEMPNDN